MADMGGLAVQLQGGSAVVAVQWWQCSGGSAVEAVQWWADWQQQYAHMRMHQLVRAYAYASIDDAYAYMHMLVHMQGRCHKLS